MDDGGPLDGGPGGGPKRECPECADRSSSLCCVCISAGARPAPVHLFALRASVGVCKQAKGWNWVEGATVQGAAGVRGGARLSMLTALCPCLRSAEKSTLLLPCRHLCVCDDCGDMVERSSGKCPVCRTPIEAIVPGVFL